MFIASRTGIDVNHGQFLVRGYHETFAVSWSTHPFPPFLSQFPAARRELRFEEGMYALILD